ncbi:DNA mismatch repair protein [Myroides marinus]|uniref:MutS-related protein n=1 Tax=Myroides marinus TaxID=703342 RepID=UPI00257538D3|nr:DNA mismatch repair protein [Myroides marinus]MDM1384355.1 DNA mismatch repair protein [Myroides marinus]
MENYIELINTYNKELNKIKFKHNIVSLLRIVLIFIIIILIYCWFIKNESLIIYCTIICIVLFIPLLKIHDKLIWQKQLKNELIKINENEIMYLQKSKIPFKNGTEYIDQKHSYSFDLDLFGENSLYQHLNRCGTYIGEKKLSKILLSQYTKDEILENQQAISEMENNIIWRQKINAIANLTNDTKLNYEKLLSWKDNNKFQMSNFFVFISHFNPIALFTLIFIFLLTSNQASIYLISLLFTTNICILFFYYRKIKSQIHGFDKIHDIIQKYSYILEEIENQSFNSIKLNKLKNSLQQNQVFSSKKINDLSKLFQQLDSIDNVFGAILINGFFLYHIKIVKKINNWKHNYSSFIETWLDTIGELETINSFANMYHNNKDFIFPEINNDLIIRFHSIGHPLINNHKRVTNSIDFTNNKLVILTGSNMSGKSTFLRTLGINMVLAGIGSPICAKEANINPLRVLVSMRQNDSLNDSESYFFSEVKRLKSIIDDLEQNICFVLLDEILRGTNSDDKQIGTIGVIENLISKNAIGTIATHDLEVCETSIKYPDYLVNKCFEVEIINDHLLFDYKLKDGVCKNKSASFLMKKMNIIK